MSELAGAMRNLAKMPENQVIQYPSGRWGFVGRVDVRLSYEGTPEEIKKAIQFGPGFAKVKKLSWATKEEALAAAAALDNK